MKNSIKAYIVLIIVFAFAQAGCEKKDNYPKVYKYETPDQLDDGWKSESLANA